MFETETKISNYQQIKFFLKKCNGPCVKPYTKIKMR